MQRQFFTIEKKFVPNRKIKTFNRSFDFNAPETPNHIPLDLDESFKIGGPLNNDSDSMKIILRFRPRINNEPTPYIIIDPVTISANPPEESSSYKNLLHGYGKGIQHFSFSQLVSEYSDTDELHTNVVEPMLIHYLNGADRLLFAYGTTGGGKTFTMLGDKKNVGVIPRSLCTIFKSCTLSNDLSRKPTEYNSVTVMNINEVKQELKEKAAIMKLGAKERCGVLDGCKDSSELMIGGSSNYKFTFWISFVEIYNEQIFDLLDVDQTGKTINQKQKQLDIRTAKNGGFYVKAAKCIPVFDAEEAYKVLMVGRRNQKMRSTKLNQHSSRSHTILTLRAVRSVADRLQTEAVFNLSFCDLAGSERSIKAGTSGVSQKETSNINSSLLTLGRCLELLRQNQTGQQQQSIVPFRDSKLTRLFQNYLIGHGRAAMLVCINQSCELFDETLQVLKFSATARKVVIHEKQKLSADEGRRQRDSLVRRFNLSEYARNLDESLPLGEEEEDDDGLSDDAYQEAMEKLVGDLRGEVARLTEQNEYLMTYIKGTEKDSAAQIDKLRLDNQKLRNELLERLIDEDDEEEEEEEVEEDTAADGRKRRKLDDDILENDLEVENKMLRADLEQTNEKVATLKAELEDCLIELRLEKTTRNRLEFNSSLMQEEIMNQSMRIEDLNSSKVSYRMSDITQNPEFRRSRQLKNKCNASQMNSEHDKENVYLDSTHESVNQLDSSLSILDVSSDRLDDSMRSAQISSPDKHPMQPAYFSPVIPRRSDITRIPEFRRSQPLKKSNAGHLQDQSSPNNESRDYLDSTGDSFESLERSCVDLDQSMRSANSSSSNRR